MTILNFNFIFVSIKSRKLIQILAYYIEDDNKLLKNRELHINWIKEDRETLISNGDDKLENFLDKNKEYIKKLYNKFNLDSVFGRKEVMEVTKLKTSRASEIIKEMLVHKLIEKVEGYGKGKYTFRIDLN
ncbi:MAG: hypothetical protein E6Y02_06065 [Gemella haemolysans]|uniref:hypothetical protein n=1 Tax=Gemella haemolysans TaxID=1379 RepID=UPI002900662E|nr:hypothetical protein [Gemella haemolysans]MDU1528208.1 hypothetical protein [Gemella haemolysans]MDU4714520.1 hypothetical protein [Gemella haemolysans]